MTNPPIFLQSPSFFDEQIAQAEEFLSGGLPMQSAAEFPSKVNERLVIAAEVAHAQVKKIKRTDMAHVNRLLAQAFAGHKRKVNRFVWLRRASDQFSKSVGPHSACKVGCSHCCHIPISLTEGEAHLIGKSIGVAPVELPKSLAVPADYSNPCVFLVENTCSIYEHRPITCRTHMNMDSDSLLCELQPGASIPVPLMDSRPFAMATMEISGAHGRIADIRHWFPNGKR